ncbi:oxidoreductase [Aureococcus anophagefferens]|nr:oxidoreductase [Aureococcus anophagefferens]
MGKLDIIVYGATGFTGSLVAAYLSKTPGLRWAVAGRSRAKLETLAASLAGAPAPPQETVVASPSDAPADAETLASAARVVLSTAGPFSLYSDAVVAACARAGAYVDIDGEVRGVPSEATPGGGTIATGMSRATNFPGDVADACLLGGDPDVVNGDVVAAVAPSAARPYWLAPFGMAPINTRVVRRSGELLGYGAGFSYDEYAVAPSEAAASKMAKNAAVPPDALQSLVDRGRLFAPGAGPDAATRAASSFRLDVVDAATNDVLASVSGGDPGYDETAKMVSEAAALPAARAAAASGRPRRRWARSSSTGRAAGMGFGRRAASDTMSGKELDIDEDDVGYDDGPTEQAMPEYEDESSRLRHRQQSFQDELARTKAKLAEMPRGWESRGGGARDWDDSFWVGVFLMIFVIGLIIWGLVSEEGEDEEYYASTTTTRRRRRRGPRAPAT